MIAQQSRGAQDVGLQQGLTHHQAGRLDAAATAYRQLLAAQPDHAIALNLLGNVEHQRNRSDEAMRLIEKAVLLDPLSPVHRISLGHVHRKLEDLVRASACYREALALAPDSELAAASLAIALAGLGDLVAAKEALRRMPAQSSLSVDARFKLGVAAAQKGQTALAIECFKSVLVLDPNHVETLYNLGVIASDQNHLDNCEAWFRRALQVDPDYVDAHVNLSAALLKKGHVQEARAHRDIAYRKQCLFVRNSTSAVRSVLILFDAGKGNINLSHLFSRSRNTVIDWMIEYSTPEQSSTLPHFDLVFNAMGDPEMTGAAALPAARFVADCAKPVLNKPEIVARTSRDKIPALLAGIEGLFAPQVWRVTPQDAWPEEIAKHLPVIVRPADSHGGAGVQLVHSAHALEQIVCTRTQSLYVSKFCDFASRDGFHRKYRVIFIDRQPFAYHLAISSNWLVHYATADMPAHAWKLEEERRFLQDPRQSLGDTGFAAIQAIGARMDLDYAGVDFSVLPDGQILVFEANPVMLVHPEDPQSVLAFKNAHVTRIFEAFERHLSKFGRAA